MNQENGVTRVPQQAPAIQDQTAEFRARLENFCARLDCSPPPDAIDQTPDKKAITMVISHVEMTLDELFFGLWSTENFKWSVIANEVVGSLDLVVTHPVTGRDLRRVGAACVQITVDKVPDEIYKDPKLRNEWALNPSNKKSNALDLTFPKLRAECLKNAAACYGKAFGRDLNRKITAQNKVKLKTKADKALSAAKDALNGTK